MNDHCNVCDEVGCLNPQEVSKLRNIFIAVFIINLVMFVVEFVAGWTAHSSSLLADSLDMLGDTFVYGISLYVLPMGDKASDKASLLKGVVMLLLGVTVIGDVFYKILNPTLPFGDSMTIFGVLALLANLICFLLLAKHKDGGLNVRSAWICSRNDVIANISVIAAGFFVIRFNSMWPDIIVGMGIAYLVLQSSIQIIRESLIHIRGAKS